jgi:RNA recognition motif-containing protein
MSDNNNLELEDDVLDSSATNDLDNRKSAGEARKSHTGGEGAKLFIGSLSFKTDDEGLEEHFKTAGDVKSAKVVTDRETGRSRGFGFVEMASKADAENAIKKLDGKELDGRTLAVSIAQPSKPREGGAGGGFRRSPGGGGGGFAGRGGNGGGFAGRGRDGGGGFAGRGGRDGGGGRGGNSGGGRGW